MSNKVRPLEKLAQAASQCSVEAVAYGKCVVADYNAVQKDMCAKEFMRLKNCFLVRLRFVNGENFLGTDHQIRRLRKRND
ncbi:conserved hypothetical protein [Talaromyces stipitatus ATCC 10500]|uniref:Uncharacterized protein n=1 Tax=Talaromyces stipitatus (strain ATCC 10500 / CBS 375.48 / QM 6759 / NRRL 1006) TaxID=441959 RepID=B8M217_TALSN|nr:uncharacterized protein TSTA_087140 [Talaromyces stipitatus ATCC 10500]EED21481.1 conserved hypothetical protein [Talaromyces stipitatus ATCC 10500]